MLECAISPLSTDCKHVITGGMQNAIKIYNTQEQGADGYSKCIGQLTDPLPALEGCAHDGYIAGLAFIDGATPMCA